MYKVHKTLNIFTQWHSSRQNEPHLNALLFPSSPTPLKNKQRTVMRVSKERLK